MHFSADSISKSKRSNLASRQAKRQLRMLLVALTGGLLLVPAYLLAQYMANQGWVTTLYPKTIVWCLLPYLVAAQLLYRSIRMPVGEQKTLLLINTLLPYLLLVLFMALMQQPYSRGAVLMAATLTTCWFGFCDKALRGPSKLQLVCLSPLAADELRQEMGQQANLLQYQVELIFWEDHRSAPPVCDGALYTSSKALSDSQLLQLACIKQQHIRLYSVAAVAESLTGRKSPQELSDPLWQPDGNPAYDSAKRLIDVVVVLATAPGWLLLGLLTALAIKLDSQGPVFFSQTRTGMHGRPFRIWKFRTMVVQADAPAQFAQTNDKRITQLGRFLRKSRLDEIPQLINVLLGQMSLIGPRPEQHIFVHEFSVRIPSYPYRHLVRPGLTGWAQVMQGYTSSEEEAAIKLSYDLYYVSHYSLALDLLVAIKTVRILITGFGAR